METDTRPDTKNRHTTGRIKAIKSMLSGYSENPENIGNLPLGEIDTICNLPGEIDTILTSQPYSEGIGHVHILVSCREESL